MLIDGVIDELLESFELPIEGFDNPIDAGLEVLGHDLSTVFLHGAQRDELTAANDQVLDGLSVGVRGWTGNRLYRGGELSDETSIDRVGLGELADGLGEAADLQRRDDDDRKPLGEGRADEGLLQTAGGFDDDALDPVAAQRTNQGGDRLLFVGDGQRSVAFEQIEIELALADIGTDVDRGKLLCHEYSNLLNSGSGPIRLFELTQESMNRCTLVNGLRLQLGAVVASSWFIDELRIAHGPELIPMSARSGTYKQLQRTVMDKMPRHIGQRAAAEPRRHRAARHAVPLRSVCIYTP